MSKEELIEHARAIKEHCELSACKTCDMFSVPNGKCILDEGFPCEWDLPEVRVSEGHYEYGVFDSEGDLVGNVWCSKELAEITCRERKAGNPGRDYCVKKRLVMCWEADNDEDGL